MDRGAWWATVHGVAKELDTTWQLKQQQKSQFWLLFKKSGKMLADVLDFLRLSILFKIRDLHHLLVLQDLTWLLLFDSGCISIFSPPHLWPQGLLGKTCHNHLEVTKHNCACGYDWSKNTCLEGAPWNTPASLNVDSDSKCVPIKENSVYFLQSPLLLPVGNKGVCQKVYHHRKWSDPLVYMAALIQTRHPDLIMKSIFFIY